MEQQLFNFEGQTVRTTNVNEEPYFNLSDACKVLDISNVGNAKSRLAQKGIRTVDTLTAGGNQPMNYINESNLYKLIFQSRKPQAERFADWVTSEVLPAIRKHGAYMTDQALEQALTSPDFLIELATKLKEEREGRLIAEQQVLELKPKASYYDLILQNKSLVSVTQIAKDYGKSAQWLNAMLHELGVQFKQGSTWLLYQKYAEKGWTQSVTHVIDDSKSKMHTKWTQKGRLGIYELLKCEGILPLIEQEGADHEN